jgi:hypothetical protein
VPIVAPWQPARTLKDMRNSLASLFAATLIVAVTAAAAPAAAQSPGLGYETQFGCKQARMTFTDGRTVEAATLNFTDGSTEQLSVSAEYNQSALGSGREENHDKNVASLTVRTTAGETITATSPLDCETPTVFPRTVRHDGFDITFTACETVTVSSTGGVTRLDIFGSKPNVPAAVADVTSDTPVASLTATLETPGSINAVYVSGPSGGTSLYSPLRDCENYVVSYRPSGEDRPNIRPTDTCFSAELVFHRIRVSTATVTFTDGSTVTETYDTPVTRVFFEAPANTRPARIDYTGEIRFDSDWAPHSGDVEFYNVCESTTGETIKVLDDVADTTGVVRVLDNDVATPGAELRPGSLAVLSADGATVTVADGTLILADITEAGARVVYQVCDTFNACATATVTAEALVTTQAPTGEVLDAAGDGSVEVRTVVLSSLLLLLAGMFFLVLWRRRKAVATATGDEDQNLA